MLLDNQRDFNTRDVVSMALYRCQLIFNMLSDGGGHVQVVSANG
jgi:hypothetical protein